MHEHRSDLSDREKWIAKVIQVVGPVFRHAAAGGLCQSMPMRMSPRCTPEVFALRHDLSYFEAFSRSLIGFSPYLELQEEAALPWIDLVRKGLDSLSNPESPDYIKMNPELRVPLVEAAFVAQGLLRAPTALWDALDISVKENLMELLRKTRMYTPLQSNFLMFSAIIEIALMHFWDDPGRTHSVRDAFAMFEKWYKGDGIYGDGPGLHVDYYNSYVIQPMMIDILQYPRILKKALGGDLENAEIIEKRAIRFASHLERLISPEGTYPPLGRSITYRCGAMQSLAQMALLHKLPENVLPSQVRAALSAVIGRSLDAPHTFDTEGWLHIGFGGNQTDCAESYISTGSVYLCSAVFLPLGLPSEDPFWSDPPAPWTAVKAWQGLEFPIDHAISV